MASGFHRYPWILTRSTSSRRRTRARRGAALVLDNRLGVATSLRRGSGLKWAAGALGALPCHEPRRARRGPAFCAPGAIAFRAVTFFVRAGTAGMPTSSSALLAGRANVCPLSLRAPLRHAFLLVGFRARGPLVAHAQAACRTCAARPWSAEAFAIGDACVPGVSVMSVQASEPRRQVLPLGPRQGRDDDRSDSPHVALFRFCDRTRRAPSVCVCKTQGLKSPGFANPATGYGATQTLKEAVSDTARQREAESILAVSRAAHQEHLFT